MAGIATEVPSGVGTTGMAVEAAVAAVVLAVAAAAAVVVAKGNAIEAVANVLLRDGNADAEADCAKAVAAGADGKLWFRSFTTRVEV